MFHCVFWTNHVNATSCSFTECLVWVSGTKTWSLTWSYCIKKKRQSGDDLCSTYTLPLFAFWCPLVDAWTVAFSPDSKYIATGSHLGKVNIFGVESGKKEFSLDTRGKFILSIAYVRNHKLSLSSGRWLILSSLVWAETSVPWLH